MKVALATGAAALLAVQVALIEQEHVLAGQMTDAVLLLIFVNVAATRRRPGRSASADVQAAAWWALSLVAVIPVVAAGMPLGDRSRVAVMLMVALPAGIAAVGLAPAVGIKHRALVAVRGPLAQIIIILAGVALGLMAYLVGAPPLWTHDTDLLPAAFAAAAVAGAVEEIVFRGIVQPGLQRAAGRLGVLLATSLYTATVVGVGPTALVLTLVLAGLVFATAVSRTGVPAGAIAGHAALTVGAIVVWPALLGSEPSLLDGTPTTIGLAVLVVIGVAVLARSPEAAA